MSQVQATRIFLLIGNVCSALTSTLLDVRSAIDAVPSGLQTALLSDEFRIRQLQIERLKRMERYKVESPEFYKLMYGDRAD